MSSTGNAMKDGGHRPILHLNSLVIQRLLLGGWGFWLPNHAEHMMHPSVRVQSRGDAAAMSGCMPIVSAMRGAVSVCGCDCDCDCDVGTSCGSIPNVWTMLRG